jgi:6-phosphogluconolactonase
MRRIFLFLCLISISLTFQARNALYHLLVGTYTNTGKSEGIYCYEIDMKNSKINQNSVTKNVLNPSFLSLTADKKYIYSVNQNDNISTISAFEFDASNAKLSLINKVDAVGSGPCYISANDNHVFTANYAGGSLCIFGRNTDGSLTDVQQKIQHIGKSINTERQNEPHVHQVILTPDKKFLLANDLGTDKVTVYRYNSASKTDVLVPFDTLTVKLGSGPRHSTFSKDGSKLYLVHEIDGTVSVLEFKKGKLKLIKETTVDKKPGIVNRTADVHLSPDEKFLYVTNRGTANDITCFSVSKNSKLEFKQQISTRGEGPRNFAISPDGKYVFVAHQFTDNITIFDRNTKTGFLTKTDMEIKVGSPVCLLFY